MSLNSSSHHTGIVISELLALGCVASSLFNAYRRADGTAVFVALSPVVGGSPELAQLGPEVERLLRTTPAPVGMLPLNPLLLLN